MDKILGKVRACTDKYNMIEENDIIAIGVSGGKDSMVLLSALARLRGFYPKKFEVKAITVDPYFLNQQGNYGEIEKLCQSLNVEYIIKETSLYKVIFEERKENNPCSLCARMRRGIIHNTAKENGCNKVALGHHGDDAIETFLLNLFDGGKVSCFSPVTYLSRKDITLIRPMLYLWENEVTNAHIREGLPIVKSTCPADGVTERQNIKEYITSLQKKYPDIKQKLFGAMERSNISGFHL